MPLPRPEMDFSHHHAPPGQGWTSLATVPSTPQWTVSSATLSQNPHLKWLVKDFVIATRKATALGEPTDSTQWFCTPLLLLGVLPGIEPPHLFVPSPPVELSMRIPARTSRLKPQWALWGSCGVWDEEENPSLSHQLPINLQSSDPDFFAQLWTQYFSAKY